MVQTIKSLWIWVGVWINLGINCIYADTERNNAGMYSIRTWSNSLWQRPWGSQSVTALTAVLAHCRMVTSDRTVLRVSNSDWFAQNLVAGGRPIWTEQRIFQSVLRACLINFKPDDCTQKERSCSLLFFAAVHHYRWVICIGIGFCPEPTTFQDNGNSVHAIGGVPHQVLKLINAYHYVAVFLRGEGGGE